MRLGLFDWALIACAVGCVVAVVFAPDRLNLVKAALAFWGAACVALVAVNIALRAASEVPRLRRRIASLEEEITDLQRDVARLVRTHGGDEGP